MTSHVSHYEAHNLKDKDGKIIPWAKHVTNSTITKRRGKLAGMAAFYDEQFILNADGKKDEHKRRSVEMGLGFISCEQALGQIIGNYILDNNEFVGSDSIPVIYAPDGGLPAAKGVEQAYKSKNKSVNIYAAEQLRESNAYEYGIPPEALEVARKSGSMVICEDTIRKGRALASILASVPKDFRGKIHIAVNNDPYYGSRNSQDVPADYIGKNLLTKLMSDINSPGSGYGFQVLYYVGNRDRSHTIDLLDVGDTIQEVHDELKSGKKWLGDALLKRGIKQKPTIEKN